MQNDIIFKKYNTYLLYYQSIFKFHTRLAYGLFEKY
jgi:hypothetical protein